MRGKLGQLFGRSAVKLDSHQSQGDSDAPSPDSQGTTEETGLRPLAVGIDLGTTLSAAAYVSETGQTTMVRNGDGEILTPSVVLFDHDKIVVGKRARAAVGTHPEAIAEFVKRDMGSKTYSRPILGKQLPPEVLQAYILKQLKEDIDAVLGDKYSVVITVPAYFDEPRRQATADAGQMAGLNVVDIVDEPTAAALAFGEHLGYLSANGPQRDTINLLVYDLGGGTFDVTLVQLKPGDIHSLATDGDVRLGGRDWDGRLVDWLAEHFLAEQGFDPRQQADNLAELYARAEHAKCALSVRPTTNVRLAFAGRETTVTVTRDIFEDLTADLLERTSYTTRQV